MAIETADGLSKKIKSLVKGRVLAIQIKTVTEGFMAHAMPTAELARDRVRQRMEKDGNVSLSLAEVQALTITESERAVAMGRGKTLAECIDSLTTALAVLDQVPASKRAKLTPEQKAKVKPVKPKPAANPAVKDPGKVKLVAEAKKARAKK